MICPLGDWLWVPRHIHHLYILSSHFIWGSHIIICCQKSVIQLGIGWESELGSSHPKVSQDHLGDSVLFSLVESFDTQPESAWWWGGSVHSVHIQVVYLDPWGSRGWVSYVQYVVSRFWFHSFCFLLEWLAMLLHVVLSLRWPSYRWKSSITTGDIRYTP